MRLLGLHEAGTQVFTDDSDSFKSHWKVFAEEGPGDDAQLESESQEKISQIQKIRTQEIQDQNQILNSEIKKKSKPRNTNSWNYKSIYPQQRGKEGSEEIFLDR